LVGTTLIAELDGDPRRFAHCEALMNGRAGGLSFK
jgi:hypothetical protein